MNGKKSNRIDAGKLGLWECCGGVWYTAAGRCAKCGKTSADNHATGLPTAKPESVKLEALDRGAQKQSFVPRPDAKFIVVFARGYSGIPLDEDNLVASFKALRDAVADQILNVASDAEREGLQWEYRQFKGKGTSVAIYERGKSNEN